MGLFSKTKNTAVKEGLRMVGADEVRRGFRVNLEMIKSAVSYNLTKRAPSEARFSMDTSRYIQIQKEFKKILFLFIFIFIFAIIYFVISLAEHNWKLSLMTFGFAALCVALMFRYHFWLYQMKRKRLGCSFQDWYQDEIKARFQRKATKKGG